MIPKKVVVSLALSEALPLSGVQAIEFLLTSYLPVPQGLLAVSPNLPPPPESLPDELLL